MTAPVRLALFGTMGCHLCEQAESMLLPLAEREGWQLQRCDIAEQRNSESLIEQLGLRIPVLRREHAASGQSDLPATVAQGDELDWPFDEARVLAWLAADAGL